MPLAPERSALSTRPSKLGLFLGFAKIGAFGFGGVAAYARHVIVEERGWLSDAEYLDLLGVGQALPGPNTMNAAILIGHRYHGAAGATLGVVVGFSELYDRLAGRPDIVAALGGAAAAAAGLVIGTAAKMARRTRWTATRTAVAVAAFATVGVLGLPLVPVVLTLGVLSVALASG